MRVAHISDTHLGYRQYNLDEREKDFYDVFERAMDKVLEERADLLLHSGDLFDSPTPPIKALYVFKKALQKLDGRVKVYAILGDHDMPKRKAMPPHRLFDLRVLGIGKLEWKEINGVLIAGISNLRGRAVELLKEELKKFDALAKKYKKSILMAHQAIKKYLPFEEAYEIDEDDLPRKASYYAFGHLHSRIKVRFGEGYLAYAGSTEIVRRDEIGSCKEKGKGFYLVDLEGDEVEIHEVDLDIRPQIKVEVEEKELEKVLSYITPNQPKLPILHVTVKGKNINRQNVIERLDSLLKEKVLIFKTYFKDLDKPEIEKIKKSAMDLKSVMKDYLKDEELASLAMDLYKLLAEGDVEGAKEVAEDYLKLKIRGSRHDFKES